MQSWVWVLAVADSESRAGALVDVYNERKTAQSAFRDALKRYGGNRRYDVRLVLVKSVEKFLSTHPEYRPSVA